MEKDDVTLDALLRAVWDKAISGDVSDARVALRIIEQQARLLGLHQPGSDLGGMARSAPETVVVPPEEMQRVSAPASAELTARRLPPGSLNWLMTCPRRTVMC
jgi:hypothetical protein